MLARYSRPLAALAAMAMLSCTNIPDSYAPPIQRKPLTGPEASAFGHFVNMSDSTADAYIVGDITRSTEGTGYRWVYKRPELRFLLTRTANLKFKMDFAIPEVTMNQTGPVTISFFINGQLLDRVRYDTPGEKHFEKAVPTSWLRTDAPTLVAAEIDKMFVAKEDGARLGFVLVRAGFVE